MYVRRVTIENVKSFADKQTFELGPGVNFFVGDNNSGKSTVLEALLFLFEGPSANRWQPDSFYSRGSTRPTRVEAEIAGDIESLVSRENFKLLEKFAFEDRGELVLRLERSSEVRSVLQNRKPKDLSVKTVCWWNPESLQFENPTGIDAKVKSIFDFEAFWADAQVGDHLDFAGTKTLGRLLDAAFKRFSQTPKWEALAKAHQEAFSEDDEASFLFETANLAEGIKQLVDEQYGEAGYRFEFGLPDAAVFMKQGILQVDDGAGETPVEGKGTGMQRAIALAVIQLFARAGGLDKSENPTPLVLMLDEPETWLHPTAQLRLGDALSSIGEREQVFVITHSPYLIRKFDSKRHRLTVLTGKGATRVIEPSAKLGLLGQGEPSWGEINYRAFGIVSNDFHNELYGRVQWHYEQTGLNGREAKEVEIDNFLAAQGLEKSKTWERSSGMSYPATLPGYVRNSIHHPENPLNIPFTQEELRVSTEALISIVERLPPLP